MPTTNKVRVQTFKYDRDLVEGDVLKRKRDELFFTLRKVHHVEGLGWRNYRYFEFDGFLVEQKVLKKMFVSEVFGENNIEGKKLKVYEYL